MIARHEGAAELPSIWSRLAAPLDPETIAWRQDGRATANGRGGFAARFVAYIDASTVFKRLDAVVPGEWSLTLEPLPTTIDNAENGDVAPFSFKARLNVLGVVREDVGVGKDVKQASTDAFKRAAVRFGIGTELYDIGQLWVAVDGDGKYAKPLEDPKAVYARKASGEATPPPAPRAERTQRPATREEPTRGEGHAVDRPCPKCGGKMWDNRVGKKNPKAPDFKCRDRGCDGVIWPSRSRSGDDAPPEGGINLSDIPLSPAGIDEEDDDLPF